LFDFVTKVLKKLSVRQSVYEPGSANGSWLLADRCHLPDGDMDLYCCMIALLLYRF